MAPILAKNGIIPESMANAIVHAHGDGIAPIEAVTDRNEVQQAAASMLQKAAVRAWEQDDMGNVVKAADVWTKVVGARAPERHEHAHVVSTYEAMTPKARSAWLREKAAKLLAEAERLDALSR